MGSEPLIPAPYLVAGLNRACVKGQAISPFGTALSFNELDYRTRACCSSAARMRLFNPAKEPFAAFAKTRSTLIRTLRDKSTFLMVPVCSVCAVLLTAVKCQELPMAKI